MTSLAHLKSPGDLHAELIMSRTGFAGSFMLVEGDDDARFWRLKIAARACELVIGGGRPNVEGCIHLVDTHRFHGALGIVDADFSGIDGASPSPNLIYTEHHDLEAMLLQSSALDAVLVEHGDPGRIQAFETRAGHGVREALLARGLPFGRLRWLSQRHELNIPFKVLNVPRFLKESGWHLDTEGLHREAAALCKRPLDELHALLEALPPTDPWHLCQGHDLLHILNFGLASVLGHKHVGHDELGKFLRQAIQHHELHPSRLYRDIRAWESHNPPYRVLPAPLQAAS